MTLLSIAVFSVGALLFGFSPARWRGWLLLIASIFAIYWLQLPIRLQPLDFVLPVGTLALAVAGWLVTRQSDGPLERDNLLTLGIIIAVVVLLALFGGVITPSPPPPFLQVIAALVGIAVVFVALAAMIPDRQRVIPIVILLVVVVFVLLKAEPLTQGLSAWLRAQTGRPISLAQAGDLQWLGFSYVAFRLIHTLRDRQTKRLPDLSLREYLTYLIFFPAFTAGPIDRAERFVKDYRALDTIPTLLTADRITEGTARILIGIFKKFVIADNLVALALNATNATQAQTTAVLWLLLYGYAFRLYFDFSGYSDIAIGLGRLFGIALPENFNQPYLKSNITAFWQSWHATLSNWARFYVFTPLSRFLMSQKRKPSATIVVLITQVSTMVVIGLWHGITINFVIWGVWHGIGLWVHKLWSDRTRTFYQNLNQRPRLRRVVHWLGVLGTFHFVALGWVWFVLPDPGLSINVLLHLFGR